MLRGPLRKFFPAANQEMTKAATCMFTTTQDCHFIVDLHPKHNQVFCSLQYDLVAHHHQLPGIQPAAVIQQLYLVSSDIDIVHKILYYVT